MDLDATRIVEPIARFARRHSVKSVLHVDPEFGFLGAALRYAMDYRDDRLTPDQWRLNITGLVDSGTALPFGNCYNTVEAQSPVDWLKSHEEKFDLVLAPRLPRSLNRDKAEKLLRILYSRAASLLVTVVENDLSPRHDPGDSESVTVQLVSAAFPRVHFVDLGLLALAVVKNEFLPL